MVYHYTTINVLNDIINNYRESEDKNHFVLWASSAYAMNDSSEMLYGWEVTSRSFLQYEESNNVSPKRSLSVFMKQIIDSDVANVFYQHFYREELTPFVLSFSENRDNLPMWSMYGEKGMGVCLCFDKERLSVVDEQFIAMPLLNVLYVNQSDNNENASKILGEVIANQYIDYLGKKRTTFRDKVLAISPALAIISAYIKDFTFKYENEMRIPIRAVDIHKSVHFRTSTYGNIIPFIKVPIPIKSLKEIIIGPCVQSDSIKRGLLLDMSISGLKIPISVSNIPYRNY